MWSSEHLVAVVSSEILVVGRCPAVIVVHRIRIHAPEGLQDPLGADEGRIVDVDEAGLQTDDPVSEFRHLLLGGVRKSAGEHCDVVSPGCQEPGRVVHACLDAAVMRIEEWIDVYELHDSSPALLFLTYDAMKLMTMTATMATSITVWAVSLPK